MKKIIVHNENKLKTINFKKFHHFQGDFKKELLEEELTKLKNSIIKHGVFVPKFVWIDDKKHYILDGHQTKTALQSLEDEGYDIPDIPYFIINAKDEKDAAEKLLQINSRYAKINPDSIWLKTINFTEVEINEIMKSIEIPELNNIFIDINDDDINVPDLDENPEKSLSIKIPVEFIDRVKEILLDGNPDTPNNLGVGLLKTCGII